MKIIAVDKDGRSKCFSVLADMTLEEYKRLAEESFNANGNFEGQRGVITKSAAAVRIRKRMQDDFCRGAIFPQVVLGIESDEDFSGILKVGNSYSSEKVFEGCIISIIDGMQRSNIYFKNYNGNEKRRIKVEFWIADNGEKLLYHMLALNTGRIPRDVRSQVKTIYTSLSKDIEKSLYAKYPELKDIIDTSALDHKNLIIESYLGFNLRSTKLDVDDRLAQEYQRLDMMDSIDNEDSFNIFVSIFGMMCKLNFTKNIQDCVDFVVASTKYIMGTISEQRNGIEILERKDKYEDQMNITAKQDDADKIESLKRFLIS